MFNLCPPVRFSVPHVNQSLSVRTSTYIGPNDGDDKLNNQRSYVWSAVTNQSITVTG